MAVQVVVPEVGEVGMEVTFVRWLKADGDAVHEGDPLFEVDTDKSILEVQAVADGILSDIRVHEGDLVSPHGVIALLRRAEEAEAAEDQGVARSAPPEPAEDHAPAAARDRGAPSAAYGEASGPQAKRGANVSPRARLVAERRGLDVTSIVGTGPGGMVVVGDVKAAAARQQPVPAEPHPSSVPAAPMPSAADADRAERIRQGMAELTVSSWRTIPHFYLHLDADVTAAVDKARPTAILAAAAVEALRRHPECNLEWRDGRPAPRQGVDLGLLVDTPQGLMLPAVRWAERLSLEGLAAAIAEATARARAGALVAEDYGPRSLTLSNLGMFAVDSFEGVIASPDVLLLAVGRIRVSPRWDGEIFRPRKLVTLSLSVDHRALSGAAAGRFLATLETILVNAREIE
jgi:pyruvate dehydrogenase E2 component (dihydrolipoamide acetyltransferase)